MSAWTLAGAVLASATALVIAFGAYLWQKRKDRELKLGEERREAYRRFVKAVWQHRDGLVQLGKRFDLAHIEAGVSELGDIRSELTQEFLVLSLSAEEEVLIAAQEIISALDAGLHDASKRVDETRQYNRDEAAQMLSRVFIEIADRMDQRLMDLLPTMRSKEFALSDTEANLRFLKHSSDNRTH
ncbi:hypothetical protein [Mameliella sp.]|uniref:hypothetical protein n=1 Tax=Mameliella sp. TaxID=1924940 RepID=UPI003BABFBC8